jgi:hypothetical protein
MTETLIGCDGPCGGAYPPDFFFVCRFPNQRRRRTCIDCTRAMRAAKQHRFAVRNRAKVRAWSRDHQRRYRQRRTA